MQDAPANVAATMQHLPDSPGVYLWKKRDGTVLYIGKAKSLRSRVRSYYSADGQHSSVKTMALMRQVDGLETIVVPNERAALVLEANLIKEHRPRFNITLRDDKSYPYIKVTLRENFPRVFVTRRVVNDGSRYFGPYTDVGSMRRSLNLVKRLFTVRSCNYDMPRDAPERPCLDFHIGRCLAPCVGNQSVASYRGMIGEVIAFLNGRNDDVVRLVREMMDGAAARLDFERAAELRDALQSIRNMEEPSAIVRVTGGDCDVIGFARDGDDGCVATLRVRDGKLLSREHGFLEHIEGETDANIVSCFLAGAHLSRPDRAGELILPFEVDDQELLREALAPVRILIPQRGPRRELADLAEQNARHLLEEFRLASLETDERAADPVYELARAIGMQKIPRSIACFDISTTQGTDTVGSCVWFENGRPRRAEYRKFRVKTVEGSDDFASLAEVVRRYFERRLSEGKRLPDLVVIDGGKGQLAAARNVLHSLPLESVALVSLAKREEDVYISGRPEPLHLPRRSPALRLLQRARDEAHRFAVTYNRRRRTMRTVTSELLRIPGIGPTRRTALLREFGSLDAIRAANEQDIARVPGFSEATARRLLAALHPENHVDTQTPTED
jgi:excinuclease ABC subunit C